MELEKIFTLGHKKEPPNTLFIAIIIVAIILSLATLIQGELEPDTVVVIVTPTMSTDSSAPTETLLSLTPTPDSIAANTPTLPPVDDETATPLPTPTSAPLPTLTPTFSVDYFSSYTPTVESLNGYQYAFVPGSTVEQVEAFWIGVYEVTNSQFVTFMNSKLRGNDCSNGTPCIDTNDSDARIRRTDGQWVVKTGFESHPVTEVTWNGASDFCKAIEARMPYSHEWLVAASRHPITGETSPYPWGNYPLNPSLANYDNQHQMTQPIGSYPQGRSVIGAYDMIGNVWEFVADQNGSHRIWRGGGWDTSATALNKCPILPTSAQA